MGRRPAAVVSCAEMWTYRGARWADQRADCWIWTAVVGEADGSRWAGFEVGDRSEATFLRWCERLPEAGSYRSDAYAVNRNEGLHSRLREKLNRLVRRSWCIRWRWRAGDGGVNFNISAR